MNLVEVVALATIAVGDIIILLALGCAILLIVFNLVDYRSSYDNAAPNRIMIFGWLSFVVVFGGLVIATVTDLGYDRVGLGLGMSIGLKAILLLIVLLLLSLGTSWRLSARRTE